MTTVQMRTFLTAAETLNFSSAAERLYISQATVSRQIKSMEEELAAELFIRDGNSLRLTLAGGALQEGLFQIERDYEELAMKVRSLASGSAGVLRFGLMEDQLLDSRLLETLSRFSAPERQITFVRMDLNELRAALHEGKLDAACMIFQDDGEEPGLRRSVYSEESLCLISHRRLKFGPVSCPEEIAARCRALGIPLLMPEEGSTRTPLLNIMRRIRMDDSSLPGFSQPADRRAVEPTVTAGFGVTCVNESNRLTASPEVESCPLPFLRPVQKGLLWSETNDNPLFSEFLKCMEEE